MKFLLDVLLGAVRSIGWLAGVRPNSTTIEVVAALTGCGDIASEPVVTGALIGGDNNIIALQRTLVRDSTVLSSTDLSNAHDQPLGSERLDGDEVGSDDFEWMAVQRNLDV